MNIALIIAGGVGARTGNDVPKQFLTIYDTPVIVYTMKNVEDSGVFDEIYVVCSDGWSDFVYSYAKQFKIQSFKGVIPSGETRFMSIYNGYKSLLKNHNSEDTVSIIDANRPMIPKEVFYNVINALGTADGALPVEPCYDSMYSFDENNCTITKCMDRNVLCKGQTPEGSYLGLMNELYFNSINDNDIGYTPTELLIKNDKKVSYVKGSSKCFKITTNDDFAIFKALISDKNR